MKEGDIVSIKKENYNHMPGRTISKVKIMKIGVEYIMITNPEAEDVMDDSFIWGSWIKPEVLNTMLEGK